MKKFFSILLKTFATIIVLACVGILVLSYYANPERIKPMVVSHVMKQYNRNLEIGSISWRVFPRLGISLGNIKLSNSPAFGTGNFAAFKNISVFVDTLSLLSGKLNVNTISVAAPSANLQTDKAGKNNWSDLMEGPTPTPKIIPVATEPAPAATSTSSMMDSFEFNIESVEITDGAFNYVDDKTGEKVQLSDLTFKSEGVALNKPFPVKLKFKVDSNAPEVKADVDADVTMQVAAKNNSYNLGAITLDGTLAIPNLQAQGLKLSALKSQVSVKNSNISLTDMTANLYGGTFSGAASINAAQDPADVKVNYNLRGTDIAPLLKDLNGDSSFSGKLNMKGDLRFRSFTQKKQMMQSLNGAANMNIDGGVLKGIDLGYWYSMGNNLLAATSIGSGRSDAKGRDSGRTEFIGARASFIIDRGLMTNKDFIIYNRNIYGAGAGNIDLVQEQINYRFKLQGVRITDAGAEPAGEAIPLVISGPLSNPKKTLDIQAVVQNQVIKAVGGQLFKNLPIPH